MLRLGVCTAARNLHLVFVIHIEVLGLYRKSSEIGKFEGPLENHRRTALTDAKVVRRGSWPTLHKLVHKLADPT